MPDQVTLFEVGPRDGLQSLGAQVPTETKIALITALSRAGFSKIEATSFVSPYKLNFHFCLWTSSRKLLKRYR